jgi:hypothetical protein
MYWEDWALVGLYVSLLAGFIAFMVVLGLTVDNSSWITYDHHGQHCITLYHQNNHLFSPDIKTSQNWCK